MIFSLLEELNKLNDVNTMYMYSLNFTAFLWYNSQLIIVLRHVLALMVIYVTL